MAKATINSKTGAVITVEGTSEEVTKIISDFERTSTIHNIKTEISRKNVENREQKKRTAASDLIIDLKDDGFFDKAKTLTEIAVALEDKGYIYPTTSLSGLVLSLVKKRLLGRKKDNGKWIYGN